MGDLKVCFRLITDEHRFAGGGVNPDEGIGYAEMLMKYDYNATKCYLIARFLMFLLCTFEDNKSPDSR